MRHFHNLQVRSKLLLGFGLLLTIMAGVGVMSISKLAVVNAQSTVIAKNWLPSTRLVGDLNALTSDIRVAAFQHVLTTDAAGIQARDAEIGELQKRFATTVESYRPMLSSPREEQLFEQFQQTWGAYGTAQGKALELSRQNRNVEATAQLRGPTQTLFDDASARLADLADLNGQGADDASAQGDQVYASSRSLIVGLLLAGLLIGATLALLLARLISGPLRESVRVMQGLAEGRLDQRLRLDTKDEIGQMAKALNTATASLGDAMRRIGGHATSLASAAEELSATNAQIAASA